MSFERSTSTSSQVKIKGGSKHVLTKPALTAQSVLGAFTVAAPGTGNCPVLLHPLMDSPPTFRDTEPQLELPPYEYPSPRLPDRRTEHSYTLRKENDAQVWAELKLISSSKSAQSLPVYFESETITGSLNLTADKSDHIQAITISILGKIVSNDTYIFLNTLPQTVWSKPEPAISVTGQESLKLDGEYVWPISLQLPKDVAVVTRTTKTAEMFRLPPSMNERHTKAAIIYELNVLIRRNKIRQNDRFGTNFAYIPIIRPGAPSGLRQLAYQEGSTLLGPDADPEGWLTLPPIEVAGNAFKSRNATAKCTFSLAKPLSYTRGSVIPCILTIETPDAQVLDLLSAPKSVRVRLERVSSYHAGLDDNSGVKRWKDERQLFELAAWWPSTETSNLYLTKRRLDGEIRLAKDLVPSSRVAHFSITYSVILLPFDAPGFYPANRDTLLTQGVEIATAYAPGPRPLAYAPPNYEWTLPPPVELFSVANIQSHILG